MKRTEQLETMRSKEVDELMRQEESLRKELFNLKFQHGTGQLENYMRIPQVKKEIARLRTVLAQKLQEQQQAEQS